MQNRIEKQIPLLNIDGSLTDPGWATEPVFQYNRDRIHAPWYRRKEWDYYCITGPDIALGFTLSDIGYLGFYAFSLMLFGEGRHISSNPFSFFPAGRTGFSTNSLEDNTVRSLHSRFKLEYKVQGDLRIIRINDPDFDNKTGISGEIAVHRDPEKDSMVIATPFKEDPRYFYYNEKVNNMPAEGELKWGRQTLKITADKYFTVLDWGRGVWPYKNTWYWSSGSGKDIEGHMFGFNLGYGFGDTSAATENMLFYEGNAHKLDTVTFEFDHSNVLKPWKFTSNDGRFEMDFQPLVDRNGKTDLIFLKTVQHQVFGKFSGKAVLDNGKEIQVKDYTGFAEKVFNQW
ncbi:MAG: DUF2804 domain-containing protein [Spirochaetia bacterium]